MAGWTTLDELLRLEAKQLTEEGYEIGNLKERIAAAGKDEAALNAIYDSIQDLPRKADYPYEEPEQDLAEIRALRPVGCIAGNNRKFAEKLPDDVLLDKMHGAWLGRACGCALGKPIEMGPFMGGRDGVPGYKWVEKWFKGADAWPIADYTPGHSRLEEEGVVMGDHCWKSQLEHIQYMESDDDIRYTVLGLKMLETYGRDWTTWELGKMWHDALTYGQVCTAETQAYANFFAVTSHMHGARPEDWEEKLDYVRHYRNPYREFIGAQIRVDAYGYGAAGDPELAAELAHRDARFSHVKNGVYGAMFFAAVIAAAFYESDSEKLMQIGLSEIPANCRLAQAIKEAVVIGKQAQTPLELCEKVYDAFGAYDAVHTVNNAALCAATLVFANGDYEKAIATAVLGGWDTDCNGATVGSVMGAIYGAKALPEKWTARMHDTLYSDIIDFHPITFTECAKRTLAAHKKIVE